MDSSSKSSFWLFCSSIAAVMPSIRVEPCAVVLKNCKCLLRAFDIASFVVYIFFKTGIIENAKPVFCHVSKLKFASIANERKNTFRISLLLTTVLFLEPDSSGETAKFISSDASFLWVMDVIISAIITPRPPMAIIGSFK